MAETSQINLVVILTPGPGQSNPFSRLSPTAAGWNSIGAGIRGGLEVSTILVAVL